MQQEKQAKIRILTLRYLMIIAMCFFIGTFLLFITQKKESDTHVSPTKILQKSPPLLWSKLGIEDVTCPDYVNQQKLYDAINQKKIIEHPCFIIYQK